MPQGRSRLLITAGPTHEPIDRVRFIGNRSSGRLGIALAEAAAASGWQVTLLLGPTPRTSADSRIRVHRFQTTADLELLLSQHFPDCHVLVMAAAVADYRPRPAPPDADGKLKRDPAGLTLHLDPTPDLLAGCAARRDPSQLLIGFALEPRARMIDSARDKLARKRVDLIVANPLETMDADGIEAAVVGPAGPIASTPGPIDKALFAPWLLDVINRARPASTPTGSGPLSIPHPDGSPLTRADPA